MRTSFPLVISPQPDETTCGPACLHTVYRYFNDQVALEKVIGEVDTFDEGGTLGVWLGCHALRRGYRVTIYSYNLQVFDPTWFGHDIDFIIGRLKQQMTYKKDHKLRVATQAYIQFLELGGKVRFRDLEASLIRKYVKRHVPILTGLSATYLYRSAREFGPDGEFDDVRGEPAGHFVIIHGYDRSKRSVYVADPLQVNPLAEGHLYEVDINRLIGSILLGIITYDANLLVIHPPKKTDADSIRRQ